MGTIGNGVVLNGLPFKIIPLNTPAPTPPPTTAPTPSPTTPQVITSDLIMWLDPGNSSSYNGGNITTSPGNTGKTWNSVSGSSNQPFAIYSYTNGRLTTSTNWFTTTGDLRFVTTTQVSPQPPNSYWTIEFWVNVASNLVSYPYLMSSTLGGAGSNNVLPYALGSTAGSNNGQVAAGGSTSGAWKTSGLTPTLTGAGWKQVVGTADTANGGTYTVYLNGVQTVQQTNQGLIGVNGATNSLTQINQDPGQNGGNFNASWGQVRMYSRPLTLSEVQNNYNVQKAIYGL